MGERGPANKPTHLKLLQGTYRVDRVAPNEPQPRAQAPPCPKDLSPMAKRIWRKLVPELKRLGLITIVDGELLTVYCETYAEWWEYKDKLRKYGDVQIIKDDEGNPKYVQQSPYVGMKNKAALLLKGYAAEFGFSPASRTRISMMPPKEDSEDPFEELLKRGNRNPA